MQMHNFVSSCCSLCTQALAHVDVHEVSPDSGLDACKVRYIYRGLAGGRPSMSLCHLLNRIYKVLLEHTHWAILHRALHCE